VHAYQRKTIQLMQFWDIVDDPRRLVVTTCAIITHGIFVHILVTGKTICWCFRKNKVTVTIQALCIQVRPFQWKCCVAMIKIQTVKIDLPAIGSMAQSTIDLKVLTMGILAKEDNDLK